MRHIAPLLVLATLAAGCAGLGAENPDSPDAGVSDPLCALTLRSPAQDERIPHAALRLDADADQFGFRDHSWEVRFEEEPELIAHETAAADGSAIHFVPDRAGYYRIKVEGHVDGKACDGAADVLNVVEENARWRSYQIAAVPAPAQAAPVQVVGRELPGGGNYYLGRHVLQSGPEAVGTVVGPGAGGAPLAGAYLRATLEGTSLAIETHADESGVYRLRLPAGVYRVLVVPKDPSIAPYLTAQLSSSLASTLVVPAGAAIGGQVVDGSGQPVEGAVVSLVAGGVSSTLGVSGADGSFALSARAGPLDSVSVAPPAGSGLPRLEVAVATGAIAGGDTLSIAYSAALAARTESFALRRPDGSTPVPGARAIFVAGGVADGLADAGAVQVNGGDPIAAEGRVRVAATAGEGGAIGPLVLPAVPYQVFVEPAAQGDDGVASHAVDLSQGETAPAALSLAAPAGLSGRLVTAAGDPVAGARISATPRGALAQVPSAFAAATTDAEGRFSLAAAAGAAYRIEAEPGTKLPRLSFEQTAPSAGAANDLGDVALPPAARVVGVVEIAGQGAAVGVHLRAVCGDCDGGAVPAETVTGPGGAFTLVMADPGVE